MAAAGLFFVILGAGQWINGHEWGKYSLALGGCGGCLCCTSGSGDAARESEAALCDRKIDLSYPLDMSWFIFSGAMFGAFSPPGWWAREHSVPALGSLENSALA